MRKKLIAVFISMIMIFASVSCTGTFTVGFDADGGSAVESITAAKGFQISEAPVSEKTGYKLAGWLDGQTEVSFPYTVSANKTLTAKWTPLSYTITFHTNGAGQLAPVAYTIEDTDTYFPEPERSGFTLAGWYNNANLVGNIYWSLPSGSTGDKEFWAKWESTEYQIEYKNLLGAALPQDAPHTFTEIAGVNLPASLERAGYAFAGWYDNANLTGTAVTKIAAGSVGNKEFWAKWNPVSYTITFNSMGGAAVNNISFNIESEDITLPAPSSRDHYTFDGWYTTTGFSEKVTAVKKGSTGNRTYYAKWTANPFNITYELNGGEFENDNYPKTYTVEGVILVAPKRNLHAFSGWFDNVQLTGNPITSIAAGTTGAKTFYAKWVGIEYTCTYHLNNGTLPVDAPQGYSSESGAVLKEASRNGYDFAGWFDNAQLSGNPITSIASGAKGNKEFWAKWELKNYTVVFELNGGNRGTGSNGVVDFDYTILSSAYTLKTPSRNGFTFSGWYLEEDFSGDRVTVLVAGSFGNKTYYAKWTPRTFTVNFALLGGTMDSPVTVQFTPLDSVPLPATDPTRTGYTFKGWFTDATYTTPSTGIAVGTTSDRTIAAKWDPNVYQLTYETYGGTLPAGYIESYTYDKFTVLPVPTKSGLTFGGWYKTANPTEATEGKFGALQPGEIENLKLYALWLSPIASPNTQKMEAELTNLIGRSGPGFSGSQKDAARIQGAWPEWSSNQFVVGFTHGTGTYVDYEFTIDRAISDATLVIRLGSELGAVTFNPQNVQISVNGVAIDWGSISCSVDGPGMFGESTVSGVTLLAGYNIISVTVLSNTLNAGATGGPLIDCLTVSAKANIGWTPVSYS